MPKVRGSQRPELLAPAGSARALRAAVNNGADAVYLGAQTLNARMGAENFSLEALAEAVRYAHLRGTKIYLTANVVIRPSEMPEALALADRAWEAGVDAIIVQDLGFARVLSEVLSHVRLHASTQIGAHDSATVAELAGLGFSRVTLARELSISEIAAMADASGIEIEVFVHGALCFCYSGQCLLSSAVGGRSANRGQCTQPCRLPYELLDDTGCRLGIPGRYLMSPKDLSAVTLLPQLVSAGVSALKIEGRMKSPEYVAVVTGVHRAALDRALADPEGFEVTEAEMDSLAEVFSRGFTTGYLEGVRGDEIMAYSRPSDRGVLVGRVSETVDREAVVSFDKAVEADDVLEFWTRRGRFAQRAGVLTVDGSECAAVPAGKQATVVLERSAAPGDRVFRVANAALESAARRTFLAEEAGRTVPVRIGVRAVVGEPFEVTLEAEGLHVIARGAQVEPARTKPLAVADITEHVGRLGGTPFSAEGWDIELDPSAGAGFSLLHRVRREATEALEEALLEPYAGRRCIDPRLPQAGSARRSPSDDKETPDIVAWSTRLGVAKACLDAGAQWAMVPEWALSDVEEVPDRLIVELPRVARDDEIERVLSRVRPGMHVVAGNLGMVRAASEAGAHVWAHWGLNTVNPWASVTLTDLGASGVWLSPELSGREIARVTAESSALVGIAVLGRQQLMVTENCVLMSGGACSRQCGECAGRERWYALRDRKGYGFPVMSDPAGRSHLFNAVPLDLTRALREIVEAGVAAVRVDFTVEHLQEAQRLTRLLHAALEAVVAGRSPSSEQLLEPATTGHFFRGLR